MRKLLLGLFVALLLVFGAAAAWWHWRVDPRLELERRLTEALGRTVTIGTLEVDPRGHVALGDVTIANQADFAGEPLLHATSITIDVALAELIDGKIVGVARADGITLRLARHGGITNLDGFVRPRSTGRERSDLHLDLVIAGANLLLEDVDRRQSLPLTGVDVRVLVSNRDDARIAEATLAIAEIGLGGLPVRDVSMSLRAEGDVVAVSELEGRIGEHGTLAGSGSIYTSDRRNWAFSLTVADVDLDGDVRPVVRAVFPALASPVDATAATGRIGATIDVEGSGLHWVDIRSTLAGRGTVELHDVHLPRGSLLVGIAALGGRADAPWKVDHAAVAFTIADGWITLPESTTAGQPLGLAITGRVSLTGELELRADLMPLVAVFGGGAYAAVAKRATSLPLRIEGTLDAPKIQPPTMRDAASSLLGGALRNALGGSK
jgi:hypothetical protein